MGFSFSTNQLMTKQPATGYCSYAALFLRQKMLFASVSALLWLLSTAAAQAGSVIYVDGKIGQISLNEHLDSYLDYSQVLSFQDITTEHYINQFTPLDKTGPNFGFSPANVWLRFSVYNRQQQPDRLWLEIAPASLESVQLYQFPSDDDRPLKQSGYGVAVDQRDVQLRNLLFSLDIPPRTSQIYYLRVKSSNALNLELTLSNPESYLFKVLQDASWTSAAIAAVLIIIAANIALTVLFRERIYLYYGLFAAAFLSFYFCGSGLLRTVMPNVDFHLIGNIITCSLFAGNAFLLLFTKELHRVSTERSRSERLLTMIFVGNLIAAVMVLLFVPLTSIYPIMLGSYLLCSTLSVLLPVVYYIEQQDRYLIVIALSKLVTLIAVLFSTYMIYSVNNLSTSNLWLIGAFVCEGMLITSTLVSQSLHKRERHAAQLQVLAKADAAARTQTDILSRISHDIRTPMSGVMGMSELLMDTNLNRTQRDHVETIQSSGQALLTVINDIMDRSLIDSGQMTLEEVPFDLTNLVNECIDSYRHQAESRDIELISHIHPDVPVLVVGDAGRLRQILLHLLGNAFKYTDHGEVVLTAATQYETGEHNIRFSVRDSGPGLDKAEQKRIFETDISHRHDGNYSLGLGLAVSKQLIQIMHGSIGVDSELGRGSNFWFVVPLPAQQLSEEDELDIEDGLRNKRLLVVDDNMTCRKVIQQQATAWGMQVATANSGREALAMMRAKYNLGEAFDIIIIDHKMPGMTGLQLADKVKQDFGESEQPMMIMLTGLNTAPSQSAAREAGIRRVLAKPVTGKALKITLAEELHVFADEDSDQHPHQDGTTLDFAGDRSKLKILVAEDNEISQKVIVNMLDKLGVQVHRVANGLEACEAIQRNNYDLLLMDCEMPVMDGFDATRHIRQWEIESRLDPIPIIALSAHVQEKHRDQSLAAGMNDHLAKPVEMQQLADCLNRWINAG